MVAPTRPGGGDGKRFVFENKKVGPELQSGQVASLPLTIPIRGTVSTPVNDKKSGNDVTCTNMTRVNLETVDVFMDVSLDAHADVVR